MTDTTTPDTGPRWTIDGDTPRYLTPDEVADIKQTYTTIASLHEGANTRLSGETRIVLSLIATLEADRREIES